MTGNHFVFMVDGSSYLPMYEHMLADIASRDDISVVVDSKGGVGKDTEYKTIELN